ncbi:MAG: metal-dependent hydrolase [Haloferacaceae archaeon]
MMVTTHVATGLALAAPVAYTAPELAPAAVLGGAAGGAFPDLDLLVGRHRRTFHFPDYYWPPAAGAAALALSSPSLATVALALALLSAAVHSVADWFGAGNELRPWERTSNEAVYLRSQGRWLAPRYWVRYDGAPEDLLLTAVLSVPGLVLFGPTVRRLTAAMVAVATLYALVRKRVPDVGERFLEDP